jgi:hypothetical protein
VADNPSLFYNSFFTPFAHKVKLTLRKEFLIDLYLSHSAWPLPCPHLYPSLSMALFSIFLSKELFTHLGQLSKARKQVSNEQEEVSHG